MNYTNKDGWYQILEKNEVCVTESRPNSVATTASMWDLMGTTELVGYSVVTAEC